MAWLTGKRSFEQHKSGVKGKRDSVSISTLTSCSHSATTMMKAHVLLMHLQIIE
jgi:hypothetical protein